MQKLKENKNILYLWYNLFSHVFYKSRSGFFPVRFFLIMNYEL